MSYQSIYTPQNASTYAPVPTFKGGMNASGSGNGSFVNHAGMRAGSNNHNLRAKHVASGIAAPVHRNPIMTATGQRLNPTGVHLTPFKFGDPTYMREMAQLRIGRRDQLRQIRRAITDMKTQYGYGKNQLITDLGNKSDVENAQNAASGAGYGSGQWDISARDRTSDFNNNMQMLNSQVGGTAQARLQKDAKSAWDDFRKGKTFAQMDSRERWKIRHDGEAMPTAPHFYHKNGKWFQNTDAGKTLDWGKVKPVVMENYQSLQKNKNLLKQAQDSHNKQRVAELNRYIAQYKKLLKGKL